MMFDKWLDKAKSMRPGFLEFFDKNTFVREWLVVSWIDTENERWY